MNYQKALTILDNFDFRDFEFIKGCDKSIPLVFPTKTFPEEFNYKSDKLFNKPIPACEKGISSEKNVASLLALFDFDSIYTSTDFSVLDVDYMTDISCRKDNIWLNFQVKSNKADCESKLKFSGDVKPIHIIYEHKYRSTLLSELTYLFSLLDITLSNNLESIKQEYIPILKSLKSVKITELPKFEILRPGISKALEVLFVIGVVNKTTDAYHLFCNTY
jgi:hypothetical protein